MQAFIDPDVNALQSDDIVAAQNVYDSAAVMGQNGTAGSDDFSETTGNDILSGGSGSDLNSGRGGDDVIYGKKQADTTFGNDGADTFFGDRQQWHHRPAYRRRRFGRPRRRRFDHRRQRQ